jgi:hypothetical protein
MKKNSDYGSEFYSPKAQKTATGCEFRLSSSRSLPGATRILEEFGKF